jgi:hypothetical protein
MPDALYELHERLLGGVPGILGVAEDVERDPVHAVGVPFAERCEGK